MFVFQEYAGMSYEMASREAEKVINLYGWYQGFDRLAELRRIMMITAAFPVQRNAA